LSYSHFVDAVASRSWRTRQEKRLSRAEIAEKKIMPIAARTMIAVN
jgi:hypothetical protein